MNVNNDLENQDFKVGALMIDIFTKFMVVVAIKSKSEGDVASALIECIHKMGHKPEILYSDDETALSSKSILPTCFGAVTIAFALINSDF